MSHTIVDKRDKEKPENKHPTQWYIDEDNDLWVEDDSRGDGCVCLLKNGNIHLYNSGLNDLNGLTPVNVTITVEEVE